MKECGRKLEADGEGMARPLLFEERFQKMDQKIWQGMFLAFLLVFISECVFAYLFASNQDALVWAFNLPLLVPLVGALFLRPKFGSMASAWTAATVVGFLADLLIRYLAKGEFVLMNTVMATAIFGALIFVLASIGVGLRLFLDWLYEGFISDY